MAGGSAGNNRRVNSVIIEDLIKLDILAIIINIESNPDIISTTVEQRFLS